MTEENLETLILGHIAKELKDEIQIGRQVNLAKTIMQALRIHDVVGRSEQFYCTCSRAKGLDHDEEGTPYCISCQKEVQ